MIAAIVALAVYGGVSARDLLRGELPHPPFLLIVAALIWGISMELLK